MTSSTPTKVAPGERIMGIPSTMKRSTSPTILLRISDGSVHMHRTFNDLPQAERSAEAFAGAGFAVAIMSATGRFLMGFEPSQAGRATV